MPSSSRYIFPSTFIDLQAFNETCLQTFEKKKHALLVEIGALVRLKLLIEEAVEPLSDVSNEQSSTPRVVLECSKLMQQVLKTCAQVRVYRVFNALKSHNRQLVGL